MGIFKEGPTGLFVSSLWAAMGMEEGKGVISPPASSPAGARGGSRALHLRRAGLACRRPEEKGSPEEVRGEGEASAIPPRSGRKGLRALCPAWPDWGAAARGTAPAPHRGRASSRLREGGREGGVSTADSARAPPPRRGSRPFQRWGGDSAPRRAPRRSLRARGCRSGGSAQGWLRRGGGRAAAPCGSAPPPAGLPSPARPREEPSAIGKRRCSLVPEQDRRQKQWRLYGVPRQAQNERREKLKKKREEKKRQIALVPEMNRP